MAFGPLGLSSREFWCMSPGQFQDRIEAWLLRREIEERSLARLLLPILNTQLRHPIRSVDRLVPPRWTQAQRPPGRLFAPGDEGYEEALARFPKSVLEKFGVTSGNDR